MTDKELSHLRKRELLQLMLKQQKRIELLETELAQTRELLAERENSITRLRTINASASSITEVLNRSVVSFVDEYRRLTKAANKDCSMIKIQSSAIDEAHEAV